MAIDWTVFKDPVTTICAILGAGLGIFNFVQGFWQRRLRLKVIPQIFSIRQGAFFYSTEELKPNTCPCIKVVNLSNFPVTITEVGFTLRGDKGRAALFPTDVKKLPCRLEARQSVTLHGGEKTVLPRNINKCYATTECGETRFGNSPVLKKLKKLREV